MVVGFYPPPKIFSIYRFFFILLSFLFFPYDSRMPSSTIFLYSMVPMTVLVAAV